MALGDMLGSAKLSGMAGRTALYGDCFTMIQGARSSLKSGSKSIYYPISPPCSAEYNLTWPETYDLDNLPMQTEEDYWNTIASLDAAKINAA